MHTTDLIDKTIGASCQPIHKGRINALKDAAAASSVGRHVSVTALGRAVKAKSEKVGIKRMDRLIGNRKLHEEIPTIYGAMAHWRLAPNSHPVILVDWSPVKDDNSLHALSASLPSHGRSLPLYQEVHPESLLGNSDVQRQFLDRLAEILPRGSHPVVVTDGGFKTPWFMAVAAKGWDWLGRVRGTIQLTRPDENTWIRCTTLGRLLKRGKATYLGQFLLTRANPLPCAVYGLHKIPKGRVDKTKRGLRALSHVSRKNADSEKEPWLIATSLPEGGKLTRAVIATYRKRMQIEEGFRDAKNERFGLGLNLALSRSKERYAVLLLIAALASFVAWLFGKIAHDRNLHLRYQANTITGRRVLSFVYLGMRIARGGGMDVTNNDLDRARASLREAHAF
jgi:hypothetical protein